MSTVTLTQTAEGVTASWPQFTLRFMLDDGSTLDVTTGHDTNDLRAAVLAHTGRTSIAGVVTLPDAPTLFDGDGA